MNSLDYPAFHYLLVHCSKSCQYFCFHDSDLQGKHFCFCVGHDSSKWFVFHYLSKSINYRASTIWCDWSVWFASSIFTRWMLASRSGAAKTLDMPWTKSVVTVLFPRGWNSEVFGNQLMFSIYCPLYVPCNSPAPWAQLDRQTPKGAVSLGMAN